MGQATAKIHVAMEERCCILEAKLNAQLEQVKCSEEFSGSTVEAFAQRLTALEARIGSACVSDLVNKTADRMHSRISTVQAMMERRCSAMESQVCALHKRRSLPEGDEPMPQVVA